MPHRKISNKIDYIINKYRSRIEVHGFTKSKTPELPPRWVLRRILTCLTYDEQNDILIWKKKSSSKANNMKVGEIAGCKRKDGYSEVGFRRNGKLRLVLTHHIIWLFTRGEYPYKSIDHKFQTNDNKNIRLATPSQNNRNAIIPLNNSSGYKGVHFRKDINKFSARIGFEGKRISLGHFDTAKEAHKVRRKAELELYGKFAPNLGRQRRTS